MGTSSRKLECFAQTETHRIHATYGIFTYICNTKQPNVGKYTYEGFLKIGVPQKWMVYNGNPYFLMDDSGGKPHQFRKHPYTVRPMSSMDQTHPLDQDERCCFWPRFHDLLAAFCESTWRWPISGVALHGVVQGLDHLRKIYPKWWFQIFFIFIPT